MRAIYIFICCVIFCTSGYGQFRNPAFKVSANYLHLGTFTNIVRAQYDPYSWDESSNLGYGSSYTVREAYDTKPGVDLSFNFDLYTHKQFFIRTGLNIQWYNYTRTVGNIVVDNQFNSIMINPKIDRTHAFYLQIPVMIGRAFFKERLKVQIGAAPSLLLRATPGDGFSNVLANGIIETSYSISKRLALHLNHMRSFTPVYDKGNRPGGKAVFNSFSLGISCRVDKLIQ